MKNILALAVGAGGIDKLVKNNIKKNLNKIEEEKQQR